MTLAIAACAGAGFPGGGWRGFAAALAVLAASGTGVDAQGRSTGPRLIEAVKRQDAAAVERLLAASVDVDAAQADGATALHWAAYLDDLETARMLLDAGADAGAANTHGVVPLALACTNANDELVGLLLAAGADAKAAVGTGETALMSCARTGNAAAVAALLAGGAEVNAAESEEDQTALMWAAARRHPSVVRVLLDAGADVQRRSRVRRLVVSRRLESNLRSGEPDRRNRADAAETGLGGYTALLFAARHGAVDAARLLLAAGANVDDTAPDGRAALLLAAHGGHADFVRFLLAAGADPNASAAGYTALHAAVLQGDPGMVEALLAAGARPDAQVIKATRVTRNGQALMIGDHLLGATPFALAAKFAEGGIMRALLAAGADGVLPLRNGWTPLMLASGASWRYGVWDRRDRALHLDFAFQAEHVDEEGTLDAVRAALEAGGDVNAVDETGSAALHHVADKGFGRVVELLVEHGADPNAVNHRGQTPLSLVTGRPRGNVEAAPAIAALLRSLGAADPGGNRMQLSNVNFLAVGLAAILTFGLGALWYSPLLFARAWMAGHGHTEADVEALQARRGPNYGLSFVCWLVMATMLALIAPHFGDSVATIFGVGLHMWLGFSATVGLTNNRFSNEPLGAWLIDAGYQVASIAVMSVVLGLWR